MGLQIYCKKHWTAIHKEKSIKNAKIQSLKTYNSNYILRLHPNEKLSRSLTTSRKFLEVSNNKIFKLGSDMERTVPCSRKVNTRHVSECLPTFVFISFLLSLSLFFLIEQIQNR